VVPFTGDLAWLRDGTSVLRAGGGTALWDSLIHALQYVVGWTGRRAIVLVSDGHDESSRSVFDQVRELARRAGVPIYPIYLDLYRPDPSGLSDPRAKQRDTAASRLRTLARESGGDFNAAAVWADLVSAFTRIERSLRAQYRIAYLSSSTSAPAAGAFPAIEVRTLRPGVTLRVQTGPVAD
jgi:Ca-activated chloride channel family protein